MEIGCRISDLPKLGSSEANSARGGAADHRRSRNEPGEFDHTSPEPLPEFVFSQDFLDRRPWQEQAQAGRINEMALINVPFRTDLFSVPCPFLSRSAEAGLRPGRTGLDPCGGEGLVPMIKAGWDGWGVDWNWRVDVAPPCCQASLRRAEPRRRLRLCRGTASLRTPWGSEGGDYSSAHTQGDRVRSARASVNPLHLKLSSFQGTVVRCAR